MPEVRQTRPSEADPLMHTVRTVAYKAVAVLEVTYGEYQARHGCCTTFTNTPEGVLPKAKYDNKGPRSGVPTA